MVNRKNKSRLSIIQKVIICVIAISSIIIISSIAISFIFNPIFNVKNKISFLASDYYENHIYNNLVSSNKSENVGDILEKYKDIGLSTVYLRQLLYYKKNDEKDINFLKNHCDENKTSVKFYPEPPYSKTSYRIEYHYFCDFDKK